VASVLGLALLSFRLSTSQPVLRGAGVSWRPAASVSGLTATSASPGSFRISGSIGGLYPGDSAPLILTITNPQHFAIVVTSISTAVGDATASCPAQNLAVGGFSGQLDVPAGGSVNVSVPASLAHGAPDGCQGAVFPLTYGGMAHKA
jgi:hypothetical protein